MQSENRLMYLKYLARGFLDGFRGKLGKYEM